MFSSSAGKKGHADQMSEMRFAMAHLSTISGINWIATVHCDHRICNADSILQFVITVRPTTRYCRDPLKRRTRGIGPFERAHAEQPGVDSE
jgi:hypothetical protein